MRPWAAAASVVAVLLLLAWAVTLGVTRIRRLDRLHARMDAARAGLAGALERRRAAAERACPGVGGGEDGDREARENALGRRVAELDRTALPVVVRAELAEAEQLLALARRVHNDAVRDTLALRSRRLVRWLRLAGTAPMPVYFDIADPAIRKVVTTPASPPARQDGAATAR